MSQLASLGLRCPTRSVVSKARMIPLARRAWTRRFAFHIAALNIDRRGALEAAWRRQQEAEARQQCIAKDIEQGKLISVSDSVNLDFVMDQAGSQLVVVFMYSRQCGVCKDAARRFEQLKNEVRMPSLKVVVFPYSSGENCSSLRCLPCGPSSRCI